MLAGGKSRHSKLRRLLVNSKFLASQTRGQELEITGLDLRIATKFNATKRQTQRQNYMTPLLRRPIQHPTSRLTPQVVLFCNQRYEISFPLARDGLAGRLLQ